LATKRRSDSGIVKEYQQFIADAYEVVTADVDLDGIIQDVISDFTGDVDLFSTSSSFASGSG